MDGQNYNPIETLRVNVATALNARIDTLRQEVSGRTHNDPSVPAAENALVKYIEQANLFLAHERHHELRVRELSHYPVPAIGFEGDSDPEPETPAEAPTGAPETPAADADKVEAGESAGKAAADDANAA